MSERQGILWLILDAESVARLREVAPPRYADEYYHHRTLRYGIGAATIAPGAEFGSLVNRACTMKVDAICYNDVVQAARVVADDLPDTYGVPHVTLSTNGVEVYASVAMLKGEHTAVVLESPLELSGIVEFAFLDEIES